MGYCDAGSLAEVIWPPAEDDPKATARARRALSVVPLKNEGLMERQIVDWALSNEYK